jgi:hypothetical protein
VGAELSGGEAQRIKLATELQRVKRGHSLHILDEPTTGPHPADVEKLVAQLSGLVETGNTVIVVEHHMRVVAGSGWGDRHRPRRRRRRRPRGGQRPARDGGAGEGQPDGGVPGGVPLLIGPVGGGRSPF